MCRFRIPQLLLLHDHGHGRGDDGGDVHARAHRGRDDVHRGHDDDAHALHPRHGRGHDDDDAHVLFLHHHLLHALRFFLIQSPESSQLKLIRFSNQTSWC